MPFYPYGGLYPSFGEEPRNQPVDLRPCNPLPENKMTSDTGDAGLDGYTVLSRADRFSGRRPSINGRPVIEAPRAEEN